MEGSDKEEAPQERQLPGTRPTATKEVTVDTDNFSVRAQPTTDGKPHDVIEAHYSCLERLEDRYRHELLDEDERLELAERIARIRRRLGR
jgi:hypothetical protein